MALGVAGVVLATAAYTPYWWRWVQASLGTASNQLSLACVAVVGVMAIPRIGKQVGFFGPWLVGVIAMGLVLQAGIPLEAERLHVVQYALVGALSSRAMPLRWFWGRRSLMAIGCTLGLGTLEELVQWWLPNRVGAWQDVILDGLGGFAGTYALIPWTIREPRPFGRRRKVLTTANHD